MVVRKMPIRCCSLIPPTLMTSGWMYSTARRSIHSQERLAAGQDLARRDRQGDSR